MADMMAIISKRNFELFAVDAKGALLGPGQVYRGRRYVSTSRALSPLLDGGSLFLVTVRPPLEQLWLVEILEHPVFTGTEWTARENRVPITDITHLRPLLRFSTGKGIQSRPGALGMGLQTPRRLAPHDVTLLRGSTSVGSTSGRGGSVGRRRRV